MAHCLQVEWPLVRVVPVYEHGADPLLGARHALATVITGLLTGVWKTLVLLAFLLGLLALVRKRWIGFGVFVVFTTFFGFTAQFSDYSWIGLTLSAMSFTVVAVVIFRFGFLMVIAGWFTASLYNAFPITADVSSPYFSTSLFALGILAALAAYGCKVSMGGTRPAAIPVSRPSH